MKKACTLIAILLLAACASADTQSGYRAYLAKKGIAAAAPDAFAICRGYGCRHIDRDLQLTAQDWQEIGLLFLPPPGDAEDERRRIAGAIGLFEQKTGALAGTAEDVAGTYRQLGDYQLDCVDESVNTTVYLSLLEQKGHLRFHAIGTPTARLPLFSGRLGPHQSAVIIENDTGAHFAADSWFHDNGQPAAIVPLGSWLKGWRP